MIVKNNIIVSLMICLLPLIFTCGMAELEGINAPEGSTITLPSNATIKTTGFPVRVIITMSVSGENVIGSGGGETIIGQSPLSFIQIQLVCTGCVLYDKENGGDWITSTSNMVAQANPYFVKTNKFGWYQLEVRLFDYGEYVLSADIGVDFKQMTIKVEAP